MKKSISLVFLSLCLLLSACVSNAVAAMNPKPDPTPETAQVVMADTTPEPVQISTTATKPDEAILTDTYGDAELARAVELGFGAYRADNPTVTHAEFMVMLDRAVELADATKLAAWKAKLPEVRKSTKTMKRDEGMLAVLYAAETIGGAYAELHWANGLHQIIGEECWSDFSWDYTLFTDWEEPSSVKNTGNDWNRMSSGYFYGMNTASRYSRQLIFDYHPQKNSMRPNEPFLYTEALLAALRLYETNYSEIPRVPTNEDEKIIKNVEERRQSILNSPTDVTITGAKYYVSNTGNDKNDGLTPRTAWATLKKVHDEAGRVIKPGDGVFFERGGLWRGELLWCADGVTYSAYGTGEKPRIYGSFENSADAKKWSLVAGTNNIWKYYKEMPNCGYFVFNEGETFALKQRAYWNGKEYTVQGTDGIPFDVKSMPDMHYFNDIDLTDLDDGFPHYPDLVTWNNTRTGPLYLRCDAGNPGALYSSIEIAPVIDGQVPLAGMGKDSLLDNIIFRYYGNCGVSAANIQNCVIEFMGGVDFYHLSSLQMAHGAGDSIGVSDGSNSRIINNIFCESFDNGITLEFGWDGVDTVTQGIHDVYIGGNLFENNRNSFLIASYAEGQAGIMISNITIEDNYFINPGFQSVDPDMSLMDGVCFTMRVAGENVTENIIVKNNLFYLPKSFFVDFNCKEKPDIMFSGNTYVQNRYGGVLKVNVVYDDENLSEFVDQEYSYAISDEMLKEIIANELGDKEAVILPLSP